MLSESVLLPDPSGMSSADGPEACAWSRSSFAEVVSSSRLGSMSFVMARTYSCRHPRAAASAAGSAPEPPAPPPHDHPDDHEHDGGDRPADHVPAEQHQYDARLRGEHEGTAGDPQRHREAPPCRGIAHTPPPHPHRADGMAGRLEEPCLHR